MSASTLVPHAQGLGASILEVEEEVGTDGLQMVDRRVEVLTAHLPHLILFLVGKTSVAVSAEGGPRRGEPRTPEDGMQVVPATGGPDSDGPARLDRRGASIGPGTSIGGPGEVLGSIHR